MSTLHKIALTFIKFIGPVSAKSLLACCGSAEQVFSASRKQLLQIPGIGERTVDAILNTDALKRAAEELAFVEKHGIEVLFYTDSNYPQRLKNCADAPVLLYFKGVNIRVVRFDPVKTETRHAVHICRQDNAMPVNRGRL